MTSISASLPADRGPTAVAQTGRRRRVVDAQARVKRRAEDLVIVEGILRGDEDAFRRLVERYQRPLYWVAYDVLLDREEARDAVQETFIRVHAAIDRFDKKRDLMNWMFRIARNLAIDHFRRRRRRAPPVADAGATTSDDRDAGPRPTRRHRADADLPDQVAAVLSDLPIDYRLALTLREFHGLSPREIAAVTDCTYPTARWRLHRARKLFRSAWEERFGTAPVLGEGTA